MLRQNSLQVEGSIIDHISDRSVRVELPNGHRLIGHLKGRGRRFDAPPAHGDRATLSVSPFDLSKGLLLKIGNANLL